MDRMDDRNINNMRNMRTDSQRDEEKQRNMNSTVAWIALLLSIAALPLAVSAFNRSGENLDQVLGDQTQDLQQNLNEAQQNLDESLNPQVTPTDDLNVQQTTAIAQLDSRLSNLRNNTDLGQANESAADQVTDIKNDFNAGMADVPNEYQTEVNRINQQLDQLQGYIRSGANNTEAAFDELLSNVRDLNQIRNQ